MKAIFFGLIMTSLSLTSFASNKTTEFCEVESNKVACTVLGNHFIGEELDLAITSLEEVTKDNPSLMEHLAGNKEKISKVFDKISNLGMWEIDRAPSLLIKAVELMIPNQEKVIVSNKAIVSILEISQTYLFLMDFDFMPKILSQVDRVEVESKKKGIIFKLFTKNKKDIKIKMEDYRDFMMGEVPLMTPNLEFEHGAKLVFFSNHKNKRNKRVVEFIDNASTRDFEGANYYTKEKRAKAIEHVQSLENTDELQPIFFKLSGVKVNGGGPVLQTLGLGGKVSKGVFIPGLNTKNSYGYQEQLFLQFSATGFLGAANAIGIRLAF